MPDDPKKNAGRVSSMFSGIFSEIPNLFLTISFTEKYQLDDCQASFWGFPRTFFRIVRQFFGDLMPIVRAQKGVNGVMDVVSKYLERLLLLMST